MPWEVLTLSEIDTVFSRALRLLEQQAPEEAVRRLEEHLNLDPTNADLQAALGVALTRAGRFEEAVEALEAAHYLQPNRAALLYHYGLALEAAGRVRPARLRYDAVLRVEPGHTGALERIAALSAGAPPATRPAEPRPAAPPAPPHEAPPAARPVPPPPPPAAERVDEPTPQETRPYVPEPPAHGDVPPRRDPSPIPPHVPREERALTTSPPEEPGEASAPAFRRRPTARFDPFNVPGTGDDFLPPPPPLPGWDPEQLPGFLGLFRATLYLWGQQPLVWVAAFALPNALAVLAAWNARGYEGDHHWLGVLAWTLALGLGTAPAVLCMTDQWFHGRLFSVDRELIPRRLLRGIPVSVVYALVSLGLFGVILALRSRFTPDILVVAGLVLAAPFHALLAPALVMAVSEGPGGWAAFRNSLMMAGKRTWMHLLLILAVAVIVGGAMGVLAWGFAVTLKVRGEGVFGVMQVAGISLAESLWAALITICGTDTLTAKAPAEPDEEEEPTTVPAGSSASGLSRPGPQGGG